MLDKVLAVKKRLGSLWWHSLLMFGFSGMGHVMSLYIGAFLVPDVMARDSLGAVLPLTRLSGFLGVPLGIIVSVGLKYVTMFAARGEEGKVKAFCDLIFGNLFLVRGFKIVDGEKGMFVGMPQQRSVQGRWFNIFMPATEEIRQYINDVVLRAYEAQA